jgi:hypothetical protein
VKIQITNYKKKITTLWHQEVIYFFVVQCCSCFVGLFNVVIPLACQFPISWIDDGICDDESNTEPCQYDGGDCCLVDHTITSVCTICLCHETGLYYTLAPGGICIFLLSSIALLACLMLLFH